MSKAKSLLVRRKRREYKRRAKGFLGSLEPLIVWNFDSEEGISYSFEPSSGERAIHYRGEICEVCPLCGFMAGDHWGLRGTEEGFYIAKCPPEPMPESYIIDLSLWDRESQNYAQDIPEYKDVYQATVYGGQSREKLKQANQRWRESQPWYNDPNWAPCRKLGCKEIHDYERLAQEKLLAVA